MLKRRLTASVNEMFKYYPIVAITGPRQSGKTTMLRNEFSDFKYLSMEDPDIRAYALRDGKGFLREFSGKIIFDEVQRVPELFSFLQTKVDEDKLMGQFILSGSQNFNLLRNITQSLAGRVAVMKLLPFDFKELGELLPNTYAEAITKGMYPALYDRGTPSTVFYANYVETYIERDLHDLLAVRDLSQFRNFLKLCAARVGQTLNVNNLANDAGISAATTRSWLSTLEASYILYFLPPFFKNFNKRLIKSPKLYFYDTGLASFLLGLKKAENISLSQFKGHLFENLVINEYMKNSYHLNEKEEFYFWRDSNGIEVDLLKSNGPSHDAIEIKATATIMPPLFEGLDKFAAIAGSDIAQKVLVYGGDENQHRSAYEVIGWKGV